MINGPNLDLDLFCLIIEHQ